MVLKEVPKTLQVGSAWIGIEKNREDLRLFLSRHGIDIHNTVGVYFRRDSFSVEVFVRDERGRIKVAGGGIPMTRRQKIDYIGKRPELL